MKAGRGHGGRAMVTLTPAEQVVKDWYLYLRNQGLHPDAAVAELRGPDPFVTGDPQEYARIRVAQAEGRLPAPPRSAVTQQVMRDEAFVEWLKGL